VVIQAEETRQASGITPAAAAAGGDPTTVVEVTLVTCQLMECRLGGTLVEHPQYYLQKLLTRTSFSYSLLRSIRLGRYPLGQSRHSWECQMTGHEIGLSDPKAGGSVLF
jgi:hypothetical protein